MNHRQPSEPACPLPEPTEISELDLILLDPDPTLTDFREAMLLARRQADEELGENRLLCWYDRDRGFESHKQGDETSEGSVALGYTEYAIQQGAKLQIDIHGGRFVFFFLPLGES